MGWWPGLARRGAAGGVGCPAAAGLSSRWALGCWPGRPGRAWGTRRQWRVREGTAPCTRGRTARPSDENRSACMVWVLPLPVSSLCWALLVGGVGIWFWGPGGMALVGLCLVGLWVCRLACGWVGLVWCLFGGDWCGAFWVVRLVSCRWSGPWALTVGCGLAVGPCVCHVLMGFLCLCCKYCDAHYAELCAPCLCGFLRVHQLWCDSDLCSVCTFGLCN